MTDIFKLRTSDGELVEVETKIAEHFKFMSHFIEDGMDEEIPLKKVSKEMLEKIIVYCEYINKLPGAPPEIKRPLPKDYFSNDDNKWYADYVNMEKESLMELIFAAMFLDIKSLMDLGNAKVASVVSGLESVQEIRDYFET